MKTTALKNFSKAQNPSTTPITQPLPGSNQVKNNAGGFVWEVTPWNQLDRFLVLGTEGGTYYTSETKLTEANAKNVVTCIKEDGARVVNRLVEISKEGRASKNDPAIFALALCTVHGNPDTKQAAYLNLSEVCRIPTHLFNFASFVGEMRGWGRGLKNAVARWYTNKDANALAYSLIKYRQREGWTNGDLLRLSHPNAPTPAHESLFRYATQGLDQLGARTITRKRHNKETVKEYKDVSETLPEIVRVFEGLSDKPSLKDVIKAIGEYNLPHEAVPTDFKSKPEIWEALLAKDMPLTALIRNLANMTRIGTLVPLGKNVGIVVKTITSEAALKKARIHPIAILNALKTYSAGRSTKGDNTWTPIPQIVDALNKAFYLSFKTVVPTGKNIFLGLDVSGSMGSGGCAGAEHLTPREGVAALALVTANVESNYHIMGFSDRFIDLNISPSQRLDDVLKKMEGLPFAGTDCALPMVYATKNALDVDLFVVLTDNETWAGPNGHPSEALKAYRRQYNPNARFACVGMTGDKFTLADPKDSGMMDFVGFDTNVPAALSDFALGKI